MALRVGLSVYTVAKGETVTDSFMQRMQKSSHLGGLNAAYIESLRNVFRDPGAVAEVWRSYFETLPVVEGP